MTRGQGGFLLLFLLSIFLMTIAYQGALGLTVAILFSPTHVLLTE
jgi:hypothetical protein